MSAGTVHIDLDALAHNYLAVQAVVAPHVEVGAVVKSNAYQLGIENVVPTLLQQQCRTFFVMTLDEGIQLQQLLREHQHEIPPLPEVEAEEEGRRQQPSSPSSSDCCRVVTLGGVDIPRAGLHVKHKVIPAVASMAQLNAIRAAAAARHNNASVATPPTSPSTPSSGTSPSTSGQGGLTTPAMREAAQNCPLIADDNDDNDAGLLGRNSDPAEDELSAAHRAAIDPFPADVVAAVESATAVAASNTNKKDGEESLFPIFLQLNTGMNRLGIDGTELEQLAASYHTSFAGLSIACVMSHLASADVPDEATAATSVAAMATLTPVAVQQRAFERLTTILALAHKRHGRPPFQRSLANSAAVFRGDDSLHYDLVRPGMALYGCDPTLALQQKMAQQQKHHHHDPLSSADAIPLSKKEGANGSGNTNNNKAALPSSAASSGSSPLSSFSAPIRPVVTAITLPVIQVRTADIVPGVSTVGYNPTKATNATAIGVVSGGYNDGVPGVYQEHFRLWHYASSPSDDGETNSAAAMSAAFDEAAADPTPALLRCEAYAVPFAGEKGSMDSICVDLSAIPPAHLPDEGSHLYLIGPHQTVDQLARSVGLRPQEVLCRVLPSQRFRRIVAKPRAERSPRRLMRLSAPPKQMADKAGVWIYAMLTLLDKVFDEHQIRYWAEGGTLLGMVRDGGIMRHDDDADLQIHPDDTERLKDCLPAIREKIRQWGSAVGETFHLRRATFGYKLIMEPRAPEDSWQLWFDTLGGKWACGHAIVDLFETKFENDDGLLVPSSASAAADRTKIIYADPVITDMVRKRGYGDILASRLGAIPRREFGPITLRAPALAEAATVDVFGPKCMSTIEGKDGEVSNHVGKACIVLSVPDLVWLEGLRLAATRAHYDYKSYAAMLPLQPPRAETHDTIMAKKKGPVDLRQMF